MLPHAFLTGLGGGAGGGVWGEAGAWLAKEKQRVRGRRKREVQTKRCGCY